MHEAQRSALFSKASEHELTVSMEVRERMLKSWRPRLLKAGRRLIGRARDFLELDDLVSVGLLALDKAITQFDVNRGTKFEVFASSRIRFAMKNEIHRVTCPEVSFSNYAEPNPGEGANPDDFVDRKEVGETGLEQRLVNKQFWKEAFEECLTIRERKVVRSIIWDRMTEEEVGRELGLSREWVSGVYQNSLTKLKEYLTAHGLDANTTLYS